MEFKKPKKLKLVAAFRKRMDAVTDSIPWPNIHPNIISGLEIIAAVAFFILFDATSLSRIWICFGLLILGNLLDAVDGSIARAYGYNLQKGWIVDVSVDRITELFTLLLFHPIWLWIWLFNLIMSIIAYKKGYHLMIPLRVPFLVYFFVAYILFR